MSGVPCLGNVPSNVSRVAKYRVRGGSDARIELELELDHLTRAILSTCEHPQLVEKVNGVKLARSGAPNGAFYINEYGHIIVPDNEGTPWCAGRFDVYLEFDLGGGEAIGPCAPPDLRPGDPWRGPCVGVPYVAAVDDDVYYKRVDGNIESKRLLSRDVGDIKASHISRMVKAVRGGSSGRFYINEARELFTPVDEEGRRAFVYVGRAPDGSWFTEPELPDGFS